MNSNALRARRRRARGAALVEYAVTLLVAIPSLAGMFAGGQKMLDNYRAMKANIVKTGP